MPVILEKSCPACHKAHTFYLPEAAPDPDKRQEYDCPVRGFAVWLLHAPDEWKPVDAKPQGAVLVDEAGQESGRV